MPKTLPLSGQKGSCFWAFLCIWDTAFISIDMARAKCFLVKDEWLIDLMKKLKGRLWIKREKVILNSCEFFIRK